MLVYVYVPFAALVLYASLERFDFTQLTAAQDLGAGAVSAFRHILLPQIRPGLITACIFVFIPILGEFLTPSMVGGAQGLLIANLLANFFKNALIPEGAAVGFLIAAFVTILLIVFRRYLRVEDVVRPWLSASIRSRRCPSVRTGVASAGALRLVFGALIVFLYLPIIFMIVFSFDEGATPGLPITGFTLHWYEAMLSNRVLMRAVGNSITVAVIVAILATIIGTMAAFVLVRARIRFPNATRIAFTLPIMVPGVLIGVSLLIYFARVLSLPLSLGTVVAGQLVVTVPFVVLIVASRLQGFDRSLEWAAADLGASPRRAIRHIVLPAHRPGDPGRRPDQRDAVDRRVRHHVVHGRLAADAADLHLHAGQVRRHAGGQCRRHGHARRDPRDARAGRARPRSRPPADGSSSPTARPPDAGRGLQGLGRPRRSRTCPSPSSRPTMTSSSRSRRAGSAAATSRSSTSRPATRPIQA